MVSPDRAGKHGGGKTARDCVVELVGAGRDGANEDVEKGVFNAGKGGGRVGNDLDGEGETVGRKSWFGFGRRAGQGSEVD